MNNIYFLPSGDVESFNVVIEIPKGSNNKYEINPITGLLELDRVLYGSAYYPESYGFIPSTKAGDNDAVDVLVLCENPIPSMTVVKCRAIGMLTMVEDGDEDNKIIAVPVSDPHYFEVTDISMVSPHITKKISDFFTNMQKYKKGSWVKLAQVKSIVGKTEAEAEVEKHLNNYTSLS